MAVPTLKRLLFVEDEPDIQVVAQLALEAVGGFQVAICSSGVEALAKAPNFGPDLILLDVMMPGIDGIEMAFQVLNLRANARKICLTWRADLAGTYKLFLLEDSLQSGVSLQWHLPAVRSQIKGRDWCLSLYVAAGQSVEVGGGQI